MILGDPNAVVIKRYTETHSDGVYIGGPTVEVSGIGTSFAINIGGDDYYASEEELDVVEATLLRDKLNAWLVQQ